MTPALTSLPPARLPMPHDGFEAFLQALRVLPPLTAARERELAQQYRDSGDREAARQLALGNLRYVVWLARRYRGYGLPLPDLVQEGTLGLLKAIPRFDPASGVRLISYALHWIRAELNEYVLRNWRIVRRATTKAQRKLFFSKGRLGRTQDDPALAAQLAVPLRELTEMRQRLAAPDLAMDAAPAGQRPLWEPVDRRDPLSLLTAAESQARTGPQLRRAMAALDARSRDILTRRWLSATPAGLAELAHSYRVSVERIRQIQNQALQKLRQALVSADCLPPPEPGEQEDLAGA